MKKNAVRFITSFIAGIFVVCLFYFSYNIYTENKIGNENVENLFFELCKDYEKNPEKADLEKSKVDFSNFKYIKILKNNKTVQFYPETEYNFSENETSRFSKTFSKKIYQKENVYTIQAELYTLPPYKVFYYGKNAFVIILVTTLVTMILALTIKNTKSEEPKIKEENETEENPEENFVDENEDIFPKQEEIIPSSKEEKSEIENEEKNHESEEILENHEEKIENIKIEKTEQKDEKNDFLPYEENTITFLNENKDIYSEKTGFVKNEFLKSSLENELEKCGSCELDLSLILIDIKNLKFTDSCVEKIKSTLLSNFQFKELIFEYKTNGFAVICPNVTIDQAEKNADSLLEQLKNDTKDENISEIALGISSRAERVIGAERIIFEAENALQKAIEDKDSKIIGFHIDIQKYREFLKKDL